MSQVEHTKNEVSKQCSEVAKCIKCKKKCKTRGTYCTYGKHWIHCFCEKLTNTEIDKLQNGDDSDEYICTICQKQPASKDLAICLSDK